MSVTLLPSIEGCSMQRLLLTACRASKPGEACSPQLAVYGAACHGHCVQNWQDQARVDISTIASNWTLQLCNIQQRRGYRLQLCSPQPVTDAGAVSYPAWVSSAWYKVVLTVCMVRVGPGVGLDLNVAHAMMQ
jgi:hypothetical protein